MLAAGDLLLVSYDLTANPPSARRDRRPKKLVEAELPHAFRSGSADAATPRHLLSGSWLQGHVQNVLTHSGTGIANELRVNGEWCSRLAGIDADMVFIHGGEDRMSPVEPIADLVNRLPQARLDVVIDASQLLYPDRFDRVLDAAWSGR